MVERRMLISIRMVGNLWYTAWVDAGQPDLKRWVEYKPTEMEIKERREEVRGWNGREH
jgi:hypothetical protein